MNKRFATAVVSALFATAVPVIATSSPAQAGDGCVTFNEFQTSSFGWTRKHVNEHWGTVGLIWNIYQDGERYYYKGCGTGEYSVMAYYHNEGGLEILRNAGWNDYPPCGSTCRQ